jgi:DNA-binding NarL/FixJ family response regulator
MPGGGALELARRLRNEGRVRTILVTMHENPAYVRSAIAAGAHGYVFKSSAERDLLTAIDHVMAGKSYFDRAISPDRRDRAIPALPTSADLSDREREVLLSLALGRTYKAIAKELRIGARTVETYRRRIGAKLGLHTRADLLRYAIELGWLQKDAVSR